MDEHGRSCSFVVIEWSVGACCDVADGRERQMCVHCGHISDALRCWRVGGEAGDGAVGAFVALFEAGFAVDLPVVGGAGFGEGFDE